MSAALQVLSGGVLATVQDSGRQSAVRYGVPRGGAMDLFALHAANRLVGNAPNAAVIEITSGGTVFEVLRPTLLALAGADLGATCNGKPLALWTALFLQKADHIALPARAVSWGARAYLALAGGIDVPLVLGSRSTHLSSGFGGIEGRALRQSDILSTKGQSCDPQALAGRCWPKELKPAYGPEPTLRFVSGPHQDCFTKEMFAALASSPLRVSGTSNRMGYRLEGVVLEHIHLCSLPSFGVIPGVIQIPPDGVPILLMADAQTTGGYPVIGVVVAADLPLAAQLLPGDRLRLIPVTQEEALAARRTFAAWCLAEPEPDETMAQVGLAGTLG